MTHDIILSCSHGLEEFLIQELEELGYDAATLKPSKVIIRGSGLEDIPFLNFCVRQMHRVYMVLMMGKAGSLEELREQAGSIDYTLFMDPRQTFAVRGVREGQQDFTSVDMAREVGSAVSDCFMSRQQKRIHADLDNPDIEFTVELSDQDFIISINTTGESQHRRDRQRYHHAAPLKASIAASMVRLSSFRERNNLLDPMAGGGTIPAEAYMMAANIPPGMLTNQFAFQKLGFIDHSQWKTLREKLIGEIRKDVSVRIGAADKYHTNVMGMKENLRDYGITIYRGDARKLNYFKPGTYDLIVCNPPFGLRIGDKHMTRALYKDFAVACARTGFEEVVALTPEHVFWERTFSENGFQLIKKKRILYGRLNCYILQMHRK